MSEWKRYKLGELLRVKHGWAFKGEFFSDTGVQSILTPGNFYESGGFKANPSKDRFYSGDYPKEYLCSKGDLVVAMTEQAAGLLGSTAIVPEDNRYLHNQRIGLISCNESLNKEFAYYLFMTQSVRQQISRSASGTKVKHTSPEKIYDVQVDIPKIQTQKNIAIFLSSLDKKIQINNQINQELEAMAKTLYDYWFVQFDFPDQNGKPYKSSGGKMVYHPELKREIPEGWGVKKLNEVVDLISGYPFSSNDYVINGKYKLYTIKNVQDGYTVDKVDNYLDFLPINMSHECQLRRGDLIMSLTGNVGRIGMVYEDNVLLNQRVLKLKTINKTHKSFIYSFFRSDVTKAHLENISTGTSQKNLSPIDIGNMMIPFPSESLLSKFLDNLNMLESNFVENQQLTQLRDWLLPMLMNGQVKVE